MADDGGVKTTFSGAREILPGERFSDRYYKYNHKMLLDAEYICASHHKYIQLVNVSTVAIK